MIAHLDVDELLGHERHALGCHLGSLRGHDALPKRGDGKHTGKKPTTVKMGVGMRADACQ